MLDRYNVTLGFYEPSVFHIHTRGCGSINDLANWEIQQASTLLHEYVHFLQDITSVKGLHNMYMIGEYIRYVTQEVKNRNYQVKLPIDPYKVGYNVGNNWDINYYTFGDINYSAKSFVSFQRDTSKVIIDNITGIQLPIGRIQVDCKDINGKTIQVFFGTIQIMEGMAKMIQEIVYPTAYRTSPYNPYYIAIDIANDIMTGLGNNHLAMIAIFDYSLQSSNPGWAFVNYIEGKKKQGYTASTLTYDMVYNDLAGANVQSNTLGIVSFSEGYEELVKQAKGVFKDYTSGVWLFKNIGTWYNSLLERGKDIRLKNPNLFVFLSQDGDIRKDSLFKKVLTVFGTPIVTNSVHEFSFLRPNNIPITRDEMMHVYAMMQIHQVFYSDGHFTCPLRKYCQSQPCSIKKQCVDVRCVKAPWERMRAYNRCLFNIWWKFKGFKNVTFV